MAPKTKKKSRRLPAGIELLQDGRYRIRVTRTDETSGKRRFTEETLELGTTEAQALARRDQVRAESKVPKATKNKTPEKIPTLADYSESWMRYTVPRIRKATAKNYLYFLGKYILPSLGDVPLDELDRPRLRAFREELEGGLGRGLNHNSQRDIWGMLLRVLRAGLGDLQLHDPTQGLEGPRPKPSNDPLERMSQEQKLTFNRPANWVAPGHIHVLSQAQHARFIRAACLLPTSSAAMAVLLAVTGMRLGEARLQLRQDLHLGQESWLVTSHSKTGVGRGRRIPLPQLAAELLERHLAAEPASAWLFPMRGRANRTDEPCSRRWPWMAVREARLKADELEAQAAAREGRQPEVLPPISPHDLRRTYITMMHREGVDRLVLRSLVGHTHDAMTDHYVKLGDQDRRGALQVIEGGLKKERAG